MKSFVIIFFLLSDPVATLPIKLAGGASLSICNARIDTLRKWFRTANNHPPAFGMRCEPKGEGRKR